MERGKRESKINIFPVKSKRCKLDDKSSFKRTLIPANSFKNDCGFHNPSIVGAFCTLFNAQWAEQLFRLGVFVSSEGLETINTLMSYIIWYSLCNSGRKLSKHCEVKSYPTTRRGYVFTMSTNPPQNRDFLPICSAFVLTKEKLQNSPVKGSEDWHIRTSALKFTWRFLAPQPERQTDNWLIHCIKFHFHWVDWNSSSGINWIFLPLSLSSSLGEVSWHVAHRSILDQSWPKLFLWT